MLSIWLSLLWVVVIHMNRNKVRIIGGAWRSRILKFPDEPGLRPSPDRVRETLFNWLQQDVQSKRCLDGFAGSGVLGFEALSRGAKHVTMIESSRALAEQLRENAHLLQTDAFKVCCGRFEHSLKRLQDQRFDLIFLDPPFGKGMVLECLGLLQKHQLLAEDALIYAETEPVDIDWPSGFELLKRGKAGSVRFFLLQWKQSSLL